MSTQQKIAAGTDAVAFSRALAEAASPVHFLPADAESFFRPVNTNRNWACGGGKRLLDLMVSLPLVLLFAPLFLVIAALIRLETKGPALFGQSRKGICGRPFRILKFRTMRVMEDGNAVVQARAADPRVTGVGAFLRRYSLDELPQLLNVLIGNMSLVGPRPHALAHDEYYENLIRDYRHRQGVKPGMTGWAQIHGLRGPTPSLDVMAARIDHDVFYVRRASFFLDLKILLATPLEILFPRNAV